MPKNIRIIPIAFLVVAIMILGFAKWRGSDEYIDLCPSQGNQCVNDELVNKFNSLCDSKQECSISFAKLYPQAEDIVFSNKEFEDIQQLSPRDRFYESIEAPLVNFCDYLFFKDNSVQKYLISSCTFGFIQEVNDQKIFSARTFYESASEAVNIVGNTGKVNLQNIMIKYGSENSYVSVDIVLN